MCNSYSYSCRSRLPGHETCIVYSVEEIHSVGTINNVETSYFTQLKMCYLMTTFRYPKCMNRDAGYYQLSHTWDQVISRSRAPSSSKQSRRNQDVGQTSKRYQVTHFQLCKVRSFYVIDRTN